MKSLPLRKGDEHWLVRYDEESCTATVEGPASLSAQIHLWLAAPRRVIDRGSGEMVLVKPLDSWDYLCDVVDVDLYQSLGVAVVTDDADAAE
jgi:hypothetical protein